MTGRRGGPVASGRSGAATWSAMHAADRRDAAGLPGRRRRPRRPARLVMAAALAAIVDAAARTALPAGLRCRRARRGRLPARLPAAEAWLTALTGPDGRFDADPGELDALAHALAPWEDVGTGRPAGQGDIPAGRGARSGRALGCAGRRAHGRRTAGGRREPGPARPAGWRLEFLLQSIADPSLLVPAEQAWDDDGSLRRWLARPQELLLTELGRASRIYPELATALRTAPGRARSTWTPTAPTGSCPRPAPVLDEAGFGVLAAVLVGPPPQARARHVRAHPGRRGGEQAGQVRPRPADRLPLGARGRRRHAHRGRDRRAGRRPRPR